MVVIATLYKMAVCDIDAEENTGRVVCLIPSVSLFVVMRVQVRRQAAEVYSVT